MAITHLYNENFADFIQSSEVPVLVDFWATWCGPCRMIAPIVEEISDTFDGRLNVCKVDVDEAEQVAKQFGIMSIPTLMIFKDGTEQERIVGYHSLQDLTELVEKHL